ncbi:phosphotransferase family protein [Plantactinospora sp. GCM10030261]|uniref:phosphotransferase family protein n=1 Tax=Plantactinospora sp. GCM10030261 TaxID=3273420 RepID=UPI0036061479
MGAPGMIHRVRELLGSDVRTVVPLGEGTDHVAYEVDGAYVVRQRKPVDGVDLAEAIRREADLLGVIAGVSPIPVPEVVAAAPDEGLVVQRKLPGATLLDRPPVDPAALVDQLADFLSAIHGVPGERVAGLVEEDRYPHADYLAEAAETVPDLTHLLDADQRRAVDRFLATAPPPEPDDLLLCHNDLGAEHLLVAPDGVRLTGVLDWSDAALADPAHDLGRLYRDLGPDVAARLATRLCPPVSDAQGADVPTTDGPGAEVPGADGPGAGASVADDLLARAAFHARCALIEDLAFGVTGGDRRYADAALARLARTFAV